MSNPILGDSSDKPKQRVKAALGSELPRILERVDKGYALNASEIRLLADIAATYNSYLRQFKGLDNPNDNS